MKDKMERTECFVDDAEDNWAAMISAIWARDWSDPRADIYMLEDGSAIPIAR